MTRPDPAALIAKLHPNAAPGHSYHSELPEDLKPWYCYFADAGHSIAAALTAFYSPGGDPAEFLVPVPVRTVLRSGWAMTDDGYPLVDVPYDLVRGLVTDPADDEFDAPGQSAAAAPAALHAYVVGKPFKEGTTSYAEGAHLAVDASGAYLTMFYSSPNPQEIQETKQGKLSLAWVDSDHAAVLCYRLGRQPWSDAPYEAWRVPEAQRTLPAAGPVGLMVVLVDASTGIIKAIRSSRLPAAFAAKVLETLTRMYAAPASQQAATLVLNRLYSEYTTQQLVERADARC